MKSHYIFCAIILLSIISSSCEENRSVVNNAIFTFKQSSYTPSEEIRYFILASDQSGKVIDWSELKEELDVSLFSDEPVDHFTYSIINYYPLENEVWIRSFYNIEAGTILNEFLPEYEEKQLMLACNADNVYQVSIADNLFYVEQTVEYRDYIDLWYDYTYAIAYSRLNNDPNFTHYKFFPNLIYKDDGDNIDLNIANNLQPLQTISVNENIHFHELVLKVNASDRKTWLYLPGEFSNDAGSNFNIRVPGNSLGSYASKTTIKTSNGEIENFSVDELYNTATNNWTASIQFLDGQIEVESSSEANYLFFNLSNWIDDESYTYFWRFYLPSGDQTINPIDFPDALLNEVPTLSQIEIRENNLNNLYLRKWENFESMTSRFINDDDLPFYSFSVNNQVRFFDINSNSSRKKNDEKMRLFLDNEKATRFIKR